MHSYKSSLTKGFTVLFVAALFYISPLLSASEGPDWHFNGTAIEACSCPMFCQCYFNTYPALHKSEEHGAEHFCKFNMAYIINEGSYGETDLTGVKFWIAGDLGDSWKDGEADWAVLTFQPGTTDAQKAGVAAALGHIFPISWQSFVVAEDAEIEWKANQERAEARLAGGDSGHIILNKWQGIDNKTGILTNISYMGSPRNTGFKMMPNELEAWKVGDKAFEFRGTTGFMITIDMSSKDIASSEKRVM
ncbi:DUF1326 domain-containing protein [Desulfopila sp. IMCC35008]|uniref:DUF1326 domain-containing protein n=1 Tax=Desulfopila sp. IMCC35008 TaxID=2653858 RepID=UPI0013D0958B|nr:DUF1326 domain-containing protein [Desulfopila sp. IMCC35008]